MCPFFGEAHLDAMFAGPLGVDVLLLGTSTVTTRGTIDIADEDYAPQDGTIGGLVSMVTALVRTGTLGGELKIGATIQVNGQKYRVQQLQQMYDGAVQKLSLAQK